MSGPPRSGKTTFTRYLEQEYLRGIVNMGECVEMARALLAYRGHALVIFDFPKSFDWNSNRNRVGTTLKRFLSSGATAALPCTLAQGYSFATTVLCSRIFHPSRTSAIDKWFITSWTKCSRTPRMQSQSPQSRRWPRTRTKLRHRLQRWSWAQCTTPCLVN